MTRADRRRFHSILRLGLRAGYFRVRRDWKDWRERAEMSPEVFAQNWAQGRRAHGWYIWVSGSTWAQDVWRISWDESYWYIHVTLMDEDLSRLATSADDVSVDPDWFDEEQLETALQGRRARRVWLLQAPWPHHDGPLVWRSQLEPFEVILLKNGEGTPRLISGWVLYPERVLLSTLDARSATYVGVKDKRPPKPKLVPRVYCQAVAIGPLEELAYRALDTNRAP